jgi:hypothetical protein
MKLADHTYSFHKQYLCEWLFCWHCGFISVQCVALVSVRKIVFLLLCQKLETAATRKIILCNSHRQQQVFLWTYAVRQLQQLGFLNIQFNRPGLFKFYKVALNFLFPSLTQLRCSSAVPVNIQVQIPVPWLNSAPCILQLWAKVQTVGFHGYFTNSISSPLVLEECRIPTKVLILIFCMI